MYDLVVIGAGSAGLALASAAAKVGARVALIEKNQPGERGATTACVPSKGLVQAAKLAHQLRGAGQFGVRPGAVTIDFPALISRVREVTAQIASADSAGVLRAHGIDLYHGSASFAAYDTILVDESTRVVVHRFVIATGSRPAIPDIPGLAEAGYLDGDLLLAVHVRNIKDRGLAAAESYPHVGQRIRQRSV